MDCCILKCAHLRLGSPPYSSSKQSPVRAQTTKHARSVSFTSTPDHDGQSNENLLTLLKSRKTEEAWIAYRNSPRLPNPTCLSRLVAQLSHQNNSTAFSRTQSIVRRLRNKNQLHRLDANSLGLLAVFAAKRGSTLYATSIIKFMLKSNYLPHVKAWSAVVSRLASSPDEGPAEAIRIFASVTRRIRSLMVDPSVVADSRPDTAAFNAVLNACANVGNTKKFAQLFEEMQEFKAEPDVLTYNVMIKLCARVGRKDLIVFVLEKLIRGGITPCVTTMTSLVAAYVGFGDLETAENMIQALREGRRDICSILRSQKYENPEKNDDFLDELVGKTDGEPLLLPKTYTPDSRMYTTMMKGYMKQDRVSDVVQTLEAMQGEGDSSLPDHVTYTTVVTAFVKAGSIDRARYVLIEMARVGIPANRITYNVLLKGYCQQFQVEKAKELVQEMVEDAGIELDVVSYNILIDGCILVDDTAGAFAFFNEMREKGIAPSKVSYTTLMKAFVVSGQPKMAHKVFDEMLKDPRVKADLAAWNMLVEGYCRLGLVDIAKKIIETMKENGFYPNVSTYGSLANGIAVARKPGEALLLWNEVKERCYQAKADGVSSASSSLPPIKPDEGLLDSLADVCVRAAFFQKALEIIACMEENGIAPNKTKFKRIYVEMHARMFTSKHASRARQERRIERKRAAEAFKFWLGLPNSYYGSEWRLEPAEDYAVDSM
ncbi:pentatricopeptide repeat-containing protein At3g09650, chloroplastic-like [Aristolochia californica]|uniref:pentatricopeptide repeat-containing protein At3g09650, chloroplastic-like n=1 Tax=Aristolochia californica TaxID=171875 RepID=UPI0035E07EBB